MRRKDQFDRDALHFAPFMLFPSPFPRDEYDKAVSLQVVINELMHKVSVVTFLVFPNPIIELLTFDLKKNIEYYI